MNKALFEQAQQSYESKDFASALDVYNKVVADQGYPLQAGEYGLVYHQIGNCYVKLGNYSDAINAYVNASSDEAYVSLGTVYYNLGMAYAYMNDFGNAIKNFQIAINTENYRSKFKAYTAMGNALMKSGKSADAAAAFRSAAIDNRNPDPTRALLNLGVCFMALGRPIDAVTVYESTFQYNMKPEFKNRLNANLGQAYVACGQMQNAVNAFEDALRDKTYTLSDSASVDYQRAIEAVSKGKDDLNKDAIAPAAVGAAAGAVAGAAAGAGDVANADTNAIDPAADTFAAPDSTMPSAAEQDAQFEQWSNSAKEAAYNTKKKKSPGKIVLIVLFFFIAGCIVIGSVLFCFGFGFPSQEMITKQLFSNPLDSSSLYVEEMPDSYKDSLSAMISQDSDATVDAVLRHVNDSVVYVTAKTGHGADVTYKITMVRNLLGWKIANVELSFASNNL